MPAPLGALTPAAFLHDYWQKRPLLVRAAFPGFGSALDGDELAGLACDADVESRIVSGADGRYETRIGPFTTEDFAALGDRDWTLLVQDVDKQVPELVTVLDQFAFLPAWRIDDLMVSWAADGGSVGPHVDQYDVFLLQGAGTRRWQIGTLDASGFVATDEWILQPGDMLYLPPGLPHWGVAVGPCMTWSIGLRAPSAAELVSDFCERASAPLTDAERYSDPDLTADEGADGRLSDAALARARALLDATLAATRDDLPRWFGELVTAPKAWLHPVPPDTLLDREGLVACAGTQRLVRDPRTRIAWFPIPDGSLRVCVDGHSEVVPAALEPLVRRLCGPREFPAGTLTRYLDDDGAAALVLRLYNGGQLTEADDD